MTEREFDQLLKRALEEAGKSEQEDFPEDDGPMSPRQRARMEQMRRDPAGYYRRYTQVMADTAEAERREKTESPRHVRRHGKHILRYGTAAVIAALLGGSALAYSLTGGQFFRQLFLKEAGDVSAYMDTDQLLEMGGGNVGTVLETEEVRLELLDAVSSGNSAMIAIRVTAKPLTEFSLDGESCRNYGFLKIQDSFTSGDDAFSSSTRYLFRDDDSTLGNNECILLLSYTSREPIPDGAYSIALYDLGCLDTEEVLIPGQWQLSVDLNDADHYSHTIKPETAYRFGDYTYVLDSVAVTPLSLTLKFSCESDSLDCDEALWAQMDRLTIQLEDGTVLDGSQFYQSRTASGADGYWSMTVGVEFGAPLPANSIRSLGLGDQTVALDLK